MTGKKTKKDAVAAGEPSSPPCDAHETDDAYAGFMSREELIAFLNQMLEAERAGARTTAAFREDAGDAAVAELLEAIAQDEERFCSRLSDLISRLGGSPSAAMGHFFKRALAVESLGDRLALLCRAQDWMVDRICEVLPKVRDEAIHASLKEMAAAHERHRASCGDYVGPQQAGA